RSQQYSICITENGVVLNHVAGIAACDQTDPEVVSLGHIPISTNPVPTEPVAAGAARQSYSATRIGDISVAHRNVSVELVTGPTAHKNPGETVGRNSHACNRRTRAVKEPDAKPAKLFNQARSANVSVHLSSDINAYVRSHPSAAARGLRVG